METHSISPELCVVVLACGSGEPVAEAIESVLGQAGEVEIVLSHSGGESPTSLIERFPSVCLTSTEERRTPGAARNAGIAASTAPYVAFLAADCVALPGWVEGRLERHRAGARAVASAMVPDERSPAALAGYLLQHSGRMPHRAMPHEHRFGVSYSRELLDEHGPFAEELPRAEDWVLNRRLLRAGVPIEWAPEVRTRHRYPRRTGELARDHHRRGWEAVVAQHGQRSAATLLAEPAARAVVGVMRASRRGSPVKPGGLFRALPPMGVATLAGTLGAARALAQTRGGSGS